ncbi:MAG: EscU/YscU/HrcU family type III secretion system export apparatus switch protein [Solirubrobacteraceae bacterium]|nr:EscU/YscU/HrcU family type III secretion system export apparatus switch protein [Solirubrobacteraceae bacterium]
MPERERRSPDRAAALRYDREGGAAPRVVAAGRGAPARAGAAAAPAPGGPVRDDAALAEALAALALDAEVPQELWAAVAEALVWAYRMDLGALREARRA